MVVIEPIGDRADRNKEGASEDDRGVTQNRVAKATIEAYFAAEKPQGRDMAAIEKLLPEIDKHVAALIDFHNAPWGAQRPDVYQMLIARVGKAHVALRAAMGKE